MKILCDYHCIKSATEFHIPTKMNHHQDILARKPIARCSAHSIGKPEPYWKKITQKEYMVAMVMES